MLFNHAFNLWPDPDYELATKADVKREENSKLHDESSLVPIYKRNHQQPNQKKNTENKEMKGERGVGRSR